MTFAELGDGLPGAITGVPARTTDLSNRGRRPHRARTPEAGHDQSSAGTIAALTAVLLAGTVLAVYSASRGTAEKKPS